MSKVFRPGQTATYDMLLKDASGLEFEYSNEREVYATHLACPICKTLDFRLLFIEGHGHWHAICKTPTCQTPVAQENCLLSTLPIKITKT
jgi:hypothetical protein